MCDLLSCVESTLASVTPAENIRPSPGRTQSTGQGAGGGVGGMGAWQGVGAWERGRVGVWRGSVAETGPPPQSAAEKTISKACGPEVSSSICTLKPGMVLLCQCSRNRGIGDPLGFIGRLV